MAHPSFNSNRRDFVKNLGIASVGIAGGISLLDGCSAKKSLVESPTGLFEVFDNPSPESKPFFRWWWNGDRLEKGEINRQLQVMKSAGMGGVEINPISMPEQAQDLLGKPLDWLSDEWVDMLKHTIGEAHRQGLLVDLIVGTGWPFGGEFLDPDETIQGIKAKITMVKGPAKEEITLPQSDGGFALKIMQVVLYPVSPNSLGQIIDLTPDAGLDQQKITVDVPAGEYKLCIVTWQNQFRQVQFGAPGGAGPVLDHFNKRAVEKYLHHMSDKITSRLGEKPGKGIRALFCDSIELEGANWTSDFKEEFARRKGYDITPYLPLLLDDGLEVSGRFADALERVRYDHSATLAALFMERFLLPYHEWCHENGALSRYQAYGFPWIYTDLLDGYLVPDIPEGDQWLFNGSWQPYCDVDQIRYAIWDKYAASAGHLAGRKLVSAEAMTNTKGVFEATLAYIKQASDLNVATGVNHHVLHGYNYSPPEAGFPGWVHFGCYFNEKNTWWPYFHHWTNYISRLCSVMQNSRPVCQVAVMGPTADIWGQAGLDRNAFNLKPWFLHCLWQALNHNGFGTDYVNGNILKNASVKNGKISYGPMQYDLLLLCDVETVPPEVAEAIGMLVGQGAKVVAIGKKPSRSPGFLNAQDNDKKVQAAMDEALKNGLAQMAAPGENLQESQQALAGWAKDAMRELGVDPGIRLSNPDYRLFHQQQETDGHRIFFFANSSRDQPLDFEAFLPQPNQALWKWDPETGRRDEVATNSSNAVPIVLKPLESLLLVSGQSAGGSKMALDGKLGRSVPVQINGPWKIDCFPARGKQFKMTLNQLKDLSVDEKTAGFSGQLLYKANIFMDAALPGFLDFGAVYDIASLQVNGKEAGERWYGQKVFDVKGLLKSGDNVLEIKVTNTLFNQVRTLDDPVSKYWVSRSKTKTPRPTGLVGPLQWFYEG